MGDIIRGRIAARPFIPFRLTLTNGSTQDVTDPDMIEVDADAVVKLYRRAPAQPASSAPGTERCRPPMCTGERRGVSRRWYERPAG